MAEITYQEYRDALLVISNYKIQLEKNLQEVRGYTNSDDKYINQMNCSNRLKQCIINYLNKYCDCEYEGNDLIKIEHLTDIQIGKFSRMRGVGSKSLNEIEDLFCKFNIELL